MDVSRLIVWQLWCSVQHKVLLKQFCSTCYILLSLVV